jgi:hypothetical protein
MRTTSKFSTTAIRAAGVLGLASWLVGAACLMGNEPMHEKRVAGGEWTAESTLRVKRVGAVQVSPDGQRVAYSVRETVMDGADRHHAAAASESRACGRAAPGDRPHRNGSLAVDGGP